MPLDRQSTEDVEYVCAKCGSDRIDVAFTAYGTGAATVGCDRRGRPYVEYVDDKNFADFEHDSFSCADCCAKWITLADGVAPKQQAGIDIKPGDVVWLPDGFKGTVATVNTDDNTFTVEGWHETFKAGEGTPVGPTHKVAA